FKFILPSIQQAEEQREQHADQDGSAKRKVKREVIALVTEIQWKPAKPEWQPRPQNQQKTNKRQNNTYHDEQSAHLLHDNIVLPPFGGRISHKKAQNSGT